MFDYFRSKSLLYLAVEKGSIPLVTALLEKHPDPNKNSSTGLAPIHLAASNTELFNLLIEHGGEYKAQDAHQKTPIFYAVDANNQELVNQLLDNAETATDICNDKRTPLHDCAERGYCEIATALLQHGANINAQNWNNITPLHLACCYGRFDMVELLFENGAYIDAQDDQGRTPLHYAAMNSHGDIARFLIGSNCDHLLTNKDGLKGCEVAPKPLDKELTDFVITYLMTKTRGGIMLSSSNAGICVFCQQNDAEFVFKPCEHVSLCSKCFGENKDKLKFCPMCRKTLQSVEEIKKAE